MAQPNDTIDLFDTVTGTWSTAKVAEGTDPVSAAVVGSMVIIQGNPASLVYDTATGTSWAVHFRSTTFSSAISTGSAAIFYSGTPADAPDEIRAGDPVDIIVRDTSPPTFALLSAATVRRSNRSATFAVSFHDDSRLDSSTLDGSDIVVTGPNRFSATARIVSVASGKHASTRVVTYSIEPPAGGWKVAANGVYTIHLQGGQVLDIAENAAPSVRLGRFRVAIPSTSAAAIPQIATFADVRRVDDLFAE